MTSDVAKMIEKWTIKRGEITQQHSTVGGKKFVN